MDSRRVRLVDNASSQSEMVGLDREKGSSIAGKPRDCPSCGQALGPKVGPMASWDAFPAGVKFDPTDEQLLAHLKAAIGIGTVRPHDLINNFIEVLEGEDGICQVHPENLPGVKKDGSSKHFFHRPGKAYATGTRKRRKIHSEDEELGVETRWHKTGKTRAVCENGQQLGWKKIMVLYRNTGGKKSKPEKTNWVLHQYHLGPNEEETDGELVVCKVFFQKQPRQCAGGRQADGAAEMEDLDLNQGSREFEPVTCHSEVSPGSRGSPDALKVDILQRPASMSGAVAQSVQGSELTDIGKDMQAAVTSERTSIPDTFLIEIPIPIRAGFATTDQLNSFSERTPPEYSAEWHAGEEVCTSGRAFQAANQVGQGIGPTAMEQDEEHQFYSYGGESSRQPYDDRLACNEQSVEEWAKPSDFSDLNNPYEDYPDDQWDWEFPLPKSPPLLDGAFGFSLQDFYDTALFGTAGESAPSFDNAFSLPRRVPSFVNTDCSAQRAPSFDNTDSLSST